MKKYINLSDFISDFDATILQSSDLRPALEEIANITQNTAELSFENQKSPFGKKWEKLSPRTLKKKRGNKILIESGMLSQSIRGRVSGSNGVSVGSNLAYAAIHQFGGGAGRGLKVKIPARPFLPVENNELPDDLLDDIKDIILEHLKVGE